MDEKTDSSATGNVIQPSGVGTVDPPAAGPGADITPASGGTKIDVSFASSAADSEVPSLAPEPPAATDTPPVSEAPSPISSPVDSPVAPAPAEPASTSPPTPPQAADKSKGGSKKGAVLIVIFIALVLIGVVGYFYWKGKHKTTPAPVSQTPVATVQKATSSDVTKTSSDIDATLQKVDDTKDFASADLSDQTLGLQ